VAEPLDLLTWLREQCADYSFNVGGVFQRESDVPWWPLEAAGPSELEARLTEGGHLLPLPRESAALANVMEVSIVNFLALRVLAEAGAEVRRGTERGYPDLEIGGPAFGGASTRLMSRLRAARRVARRLRAGSRSPQGTRTSSGLTCTGWDISTVQRLGHPPRCDYGLYAQS
jgi:hypothetical protein